MSGLEPLAALGLACNVMQVIHFASETASLTKAMFSTGTPNPSLAYTTASLEKAYDDLERSLRTASTPGNQDEQELLEVARSTAAVVSDMTAEMDRVSNGAAKEKYLISAFGAMKSRLRRANIEKLESSLAAHQKVLETQILIRI
jgi:hypothetical protein